MSKALFKHADDITDHWLDYLHSEATSLSQREEFAIDNYADRELINPEMSSYLDGQHDLENADASSLAGKFHLNFHQSMMAHIHVLDKLKSRFSGLKDKVHKAFCKVVSAISSEKFDWKTVIKAVLVALIPVFAGGIPALVVPLIIALIAKLIKLGLEKVCPV